MKYILSILTISLLVSCGGGEKNSLEAILATDNVEKIQSKKDALVTQQQELVAQIGQLDKKLEELNPEKNTPLITVFKATDTVFNHYLELQGSVETDQNIIVTPEMGGILQRVYVTEGQTVSKGQLLAKVDDGGMSQQLAQMQVQAELAKTTYERQQRLWDQKIGSEIQLLQAKSSYEAQQKAINSMQQQLGKSNIKAPFSGTIDDVITEQGSVVSPGQTPVLRIVSLNDMYVKADIPETYLTSVVKGKSVEVLFPVLGKTVDAKITQTGDFINPDNRTFSVEIDVPNKDKSIKPNLTARLKVNDYTSEKAILVPQSIISENAEGEQYVYVLTERNDNKAKAKRAYVTTGKPQGDNIEILEGLKAGDEIIMEGARSVKDGQTVKIISY
ncbi:cation efflux system protein/acriflavin resistance protein B family [unidentified eubacterium SCB49]|nr:cation efflux system protein/acriflavin resistance protein B family [unidentified eubacterium SCB49]